MAMESTGQHARLIREAVKLRDSAGTPDSRLLHMTPKLVFLLFLAFPPADLPAEPLPAHLKLVEKLGSQDRREREQAKSTLMAIGSPVAPALFGGLSSGNGYVRGNCARLLGKMRVAEARPRLVALLKDSEFYVRWMALDALADMARPEDVTIFEAALTQPAKPVDTHEGVMILAMRRTAAVGLYRAGGGKARQLLLHGLKDEEPVIRRTCAFGLGYLKDASSAPSLLKALEDEDPGVREKADLALQWISGTKVEFDAHGLRLAREAGIGRWQKWWDAAKQ